MLTQRLLQGHGVSVTLEEVTKKFEELYQGTELEEGLYLTERLLVPKVCIGGSFLVLNFYKHPITLYSYSTNHRA